MQYIKRLLSLGSLVRAAALGVGACIALAGVVLTNAPTASAATCAGTQTVHNASGLALFLTPNVFVSGVGSLCLSNSPAGADNYKITSSTINDTAAPAAYPNLSVGCGIFPGSQTTCTAGNPLPRQESAMTGNVSFSSSHTGVASGDRYNTALDLFFSSDHNNTSGPVSEVMIWANEQNQAHRSDAATVTLDGKTWWRWTNARTGCSNTCSWTEVIYLLKTEQSGGFPGGIARKPILDNAVSIGALRTTDYLQYEGAGNEIWVGGTNLAITAFNPTF